MNEFLLSSAREANGLVGRLAALPRDPAENTNGDPSEREALGGNYATMS